MPTLNINAPRLVSAFLELNPTAKLTGSRFFGGARADSDYDFYMTDKPMGNFKSNNLEFYNDSSIVAVWHDAVANIHVQQVGSIAWKDAAQALLANLPEPLYEQFIVGSKTAKREIWQWALDITKPKPQSPPEPEPKPKRKLEPWCNYVVGIWSKHLALVQCATVHEASDVLATILGQQKIQTSRSPVVHSGLAIYARGGWLLTEK